MQNKAYFYIYRKNNILIIHKINSGYTACVRQYQSERGYHNYSHCHSFFNNLIVCSVSK